MHLFNEQIQEDKFALYLWENLKDEEGFHLMAVGCKIEGLEMEIPFTDLLAKRLKSNDNNKN